MKMLSKADARSALSKRNEDLLDKSTRLQRVYRDITSKLNSAKSNYNPEKIEAMKDFKQFIEDIQVKKSKLLEELNDIEAAIEQKKEIYYGYIARADELIEQKYQADERDKKLDLRERFISEIEKKQWNRTTTS